MKVKKIRMALFQKLSSYQVEVKIKRWFSFEHPVGFRSVPSSREV